MKCLDIKQFPFLFAQSALFNVTVKVLNKYIYKKNTLNLHFFLNSSISLVLKSSLPPRFNSSSCSWGNPFNVVSLLFSRFNI